MQYFIIIGISYFGIYFYNYFTDSKKNILAIEKIINNDNVDVSLEDRYGYNSFIEIPSIELKRGLVTINNSYNNVNDNIEIIEKTDNRIILASHNGNNYNSYFGNLYKMVLVIRYIYMKMVINMNIYLVIIMRLRRMVMLIFILIIQEIQ